MMRLSTSRQAQQAFRRLSCTITRALCTPQELSRIITVRQRRTFSFVSLRFITQVRRCTGSEALSQGARRCFSRAVKPEFILDTVSREKCTIVWLLVPWAQDILDAIDSGEVTLSKYELSQWRLMHIGAQPVPPSLIARWKKGFP